MTTHKSSYITLNRRLRRALKLHRPRFGVGARRRAADGTPPIPAAARLPLFGKVGFSVLALAGALSLAPWGAAQAGAQRVSGKVLAAQGTLRGVNLPSVAALNPAVQASLAPPTESVLRLKENGLLEGVDTSGFDEEGIPNTVEVMDGIRFEIDQTEGKAIIDWSNYDLAQGDELVYKQSSTEDVVLNRVFDAKPSQIAGKISAKGQVWITNGQGVYFHDGAQVNVNSILATTLWISEEQFENGLVEKLEAELATGPSVTSGYLPNLYAANAPTAPLDVAVVDSIPDEALMDLAGFVVRRAVLQANGEEADLPDLGGSRYRGLSWRPDDHDDFRGDLAAYDLEALYEQISDNFDLSRLGDYDADAFRNASDPQQLLPQALQNALAGEMRTATEQRLVDYNTNVIGPAFENYANQVLVTVEEGAHIRASAVVDEHGAVTRDAVGDAGKIMLFGQNVANRGTLEAPEGQVLMAAGEEIYLSPSADPALRGLEVEVSSLSPLPENMLSPYSEILGSSARGEYLENRGDALGMGVANTGTIRAEQGNVTMVGRNVANTGRIESTSSIRQNGSVQLRATYGVFAANNGDTARSRMFGGDVMLGEGSAIDIAIPRTDETAIQALVDQLREEGAFASEVMLHGQHISLRPGASIRAPAGDVTLFADSRGTGGSTGNRDLELYRQGLTRGLESSVVIGRDAVIDVSGLDNVVLDPSSNVLEVEVRGPELAQSPAQRDGFLDGETVRVDIREGTELVDWTGALASREVTAAGESVNGGSVTISSLREASIAEGAVIDVSGGSRHYTAGAVATTRLITESGEVVDIAEADPDATYTGFGPEWTKSVSSYSEGGDAGSFHLNSPGGRYYGEVRGGVSVGRRQRQAGFRDLAPRVPDGIDAPQLLGARVPDGGYFQISVDNSTSPRLIDRLYVTDGPGAVEFIDGGREFAFDPQTDMIAEVDGKTLYQTFISDDFLDGSELDAAHLFVIADQASSGISRDQLRIAPGANIEIGAGGTLNFTYRSQSPHRGFYIGENARLAAAGGAINIQGAALAAGVEISARGQWINDTVGSGKGYGVIDGGSIDADGVRVDGPVTFDVTGGGWRFRPGPGTTEGGKVTLLRGQGGDISLIGRSPYGTSIDAAALGNITFLADGLAGGGFLDVEFAGQHLIVDDAPTADGEDTVVLADDFFVDNGFSEYRIQGDSITIADGAVIEPAVRRLELSPDAANRASGSDILDFAEVAAPPILEQLDQGLSTSLTFVADNRFVLERDARVSLAPQGAFRVLADGTLGDAPTVDLFGTVEAPAGEIHIDAGAGRVWLHEGARLLAPGFAYRQRVTSAPGYSYFDGRVLDGGSVGLGGKELVTEPGSLIDVSGTSARLDLLTPSLYRTYLRMSQNVASEGGSVGLGGEVGYILGELRAAPGAPTARGGSLSLTGGLAGAGISEEEFLDTANSIFSFGDPTLASYLVLLGEYMAGAYGIDFSYSEEDFEPIPLQTGGGDFETFFNLLLASNPDLAGGIQFDADLKTLPDGVNPNESMAGDFVFRAPEDYELQGSAERYDFTLKMMLQLESLLASGGNNPDYFPLTMPGTLTVAEDLVNQGGFDNLDVTAGAGRLTGRGDIQLVVRDAINISASLITSTDDFGLVAPYVQLAQAPALASGGKSGDGLFTVDAGHIDFTGVTNFAGFEEVLFESDGGIRGYSPRRAGSGGQPVGLTSDAPVTLRAGEVYPGTASEFFVESDISVTVEANGRSDVPLEAGGTLAITAPEIVQRGSLRAPFGTIRLQGDEVVLADGSLTSTSADGRTIIYGTTRGGSELFSPNDKSNPLNAPPAKRVVIEGRNVVAESGSVIDVSGSGDILALEFVPGPMGRSNILAGEGVYALVPGIGGDVYAPANPDLIDAQSGDPLLGRQVELSGGNGVPAGVYTLLPAEYALMAGGFRVEVQPDSTDFHAAQGRRLADGSILMAGRYVEQGVYTESGTQVGDQRTRAFRLLSGEDVRQRSEFIETSGNTFFSSDEFLEQAIRDGIEDLNTNPRRPVDGGFLTLATSQSLTLEGTLLSAGVPGARGGLVDIAAPQMAVVGDGADTSDLEGYLLLDPEALSNLGAESLLLGGRREQTASGMEIVFGALPATEGGAVDREEEPLQGAEQLIVRTSEDDPLAVPELLLVAAGEVRVEEGSVLRAEGSGAASGTNLTLGPTLPQGYSVNWRGDLQARNDQPPVNYSAFLRLSALDHVEVDRAGEIDGSTGGRLIVESGASLEGGKSLTLDATGDIDFDESATLAGDVVAAAASQVSFGDVPDDAPGLSLGGAALETLAQTSDLRLEAFDRIGFYGAVDSTFAGNIMLDAPVLEAVDDAEVNLSATGTLTLRNSGDALEGELAAGDGVFRLSGERVVLGDGDKAFNGFNVVELNAGERIVASGEGGLRTPGDLNLSAAELAAIHGAQQDVVAGGALTAQAPESAAELDPLGEVGGLFALEGSEVRLDTAIRLPSGVARLTAREGDVILGDNAEIHTAGGVADFFEVNETLPAGAVQLIADAGRVSVGEGAVIDVSGDAGGGDAGQLDIRAGDTAELDGTLLGTAADGYAGGEFRLQVGSLADFGAVNGLLNAGRFAGARAFSIATGDITLDGETRVQRFELATGEGMIAVAGDARIVTPGKEGGLIRLAGGGGLSVAGGSVLDAGAKGDNGDGGRVELLIGDAGEPLNVADGSTIDVGGAGEGDAGSVHLRAPRTGDNTDAAVAAFDAEVTGGPVYLEAYQDYQVAATDGEAVIDSGLIDQVLAEADAFMSNSDAVTDRLGQTDNGAFIVQPGIQLSSAGDMALIDDWSLAGARYQGVPGVLSLRAGGDLSFRANLSDGFAEAGRTTAEGEAVALTDDASWSYVLAAGADLDSADPAAVRSLGTLDAAELGGSVIVDVGSGGDGAMIRTGTGDIRIAAGRDLRLVDDGSVIYTAGTNSDPVSNFNMPDPMAMYPEGGGSLNIAVGGDISAAVDDPLGWRDWLERRGALSSMPQSSSEAAAFHKDVPFLFDGENGLLQTTMWVEYQDFRMGVGALGGGDVAVDAGGSIENLSVSLPRTVRVSGGSSLEDPKRAHYAGGGDLVVTAGGDIIDGSYYVSSGRGSISAGGSLHGSATQDESPFRYGPALAVGDAQMHVSARDDLTVGGVYSVTQSDPLAGHGLHTGESSNWLEYTEDTAVELLSVGGNVRLSPRTITGGYVHDNRVYLPSQVRLVAPNGGIRLAGGADVPSRWQPSNIGYYFDATSNSRLELLGRDDVVFNLGFGSMILQSDADYDVISRVFNPDFDTTPMPFNFVHERDRIVTGGVHQGSKLFNRVYASEGDIHVFTETRLSMQTRIKAGGDYRQTLGSDNNQQLSGTLDLQGNNPHDLSLIHADNIYLTRVDIDGTGRLEIMARHNLSPGSVTTREPQRQQSDGTYRDPSLLGLQDADVTLLSGINQEPDYQAFVARYLDPANAGAMPGYLTETRADGSVVPIYLDEIGDWTRSYTGDQSLSDEQAFAVWADEIEPDQRNGLIYTLLFQELRTAGREAVGSSPDTDPQQLRNGDPTRGYDAIGVLFPGAQKRPDEQLAEGESRWRGDIGRSATVYARGSGDIQMLTPGDAIQLVPVSTSSTDPGSQGVVTRGGGDISVLTGGNYIVNQSRTLTADGGDLLIWSSYGNIDAGRGAKTSLSVPPVIYPTDENTVTRPEIAGIASGAGIGTLDRADGSPGGDADLYAFNGIVNAGDAGIRASQDLFVGALEIRGLDNITVGGITNVDLDLEGEGEVGPLNLEDFSESATEDALGKAFEVAEQAQQLRSRPQTLLTGEVLGIEEEDQGSCTDTDGDGVHDGTGESC